MRPASGLAVDGDSETPHSRQISSSLCAGDFITFQHHKRQCGERRRKAASHGGITLFQWPSRGGDGNKLRIKPVPIGRDRTSQEQATSPFLQNRRIPFFLLTCFVVMIATTTIIPIVARNVSILPYCWNGT
jgi:hypothetical protein